MEPQKNLSHQAGTYCIYDRYWYLLQNIIQIFIYFKINQPAILSLKGKFTISSRTMVM